MGDGVDRLLGVGGVDEGLVRMAAPDEAAVEQDLLEVVVARATQQRIARPGILQTSAKCTMMRPVRSARSKLRMSPLRLISMSPSRSAWTVPLPNAAAGMTVTSSPSPAKWPSATPAASGA
jgi:hypothetical protein